MPKTVQVFEGNGKNHYSTDSGEYWDIFRMVKLPNDITQKQVLMRISKTVAPHVPLLHATYKDMKKVYCDDGVSLYRWDVEWQKWVWTNKVADE